MEQVMDLLAEISPSISLPGSESLAYAIFYAAKARQETPVPGAIHITKSVYSPAAEKTGKPQTAVIRAINRAANNCWMDGQNVRLNEIIGTTLPTRPKPREFILYCSYYLTYGKPYHKSFEEI